MQYKVFTDKYNFKGIKINSNRKSKRYVCVLLLLLMSYNDVLMFIIVRVICCCLSFL